MIDFFKRRFLWNQMRRWQQSVRDALDGRCRRPRTIHDDLKRFHHNQKARRSIDIQKLTMKMKYNYFEQKWWELELDDPCCDNCANTTIRRSTGVAWCIVTMKPEYQGICDIWHKRYKTARILEHHCHWTYCDWVRRAYKW